MNDSWLTLLAVIIGALIALLSAFLNGWLQRRHERHEKRAELERKALAAALRWIIPMRQAFYRASILALNAQAGVADADRLNAEWPQLVSSLVDLDVPSDCEALLPSHIYPSGIEIARKIEALGPAVASAVRQHIDHWSEFSTTFAECEKKIVSLETDLKERFRKSFD